MDADTEIRLHDLRCLADVVLVAPVARHRWATARARRHWVQREDILDALAGPIMSLARRGGCEYVYRNPERFSGVRDAEDLRVWMGQRLEQMQAHVTAFRPRHPAGRRDFNYMLELLDELRELTELAARLASLQVTYGEASGDMRLEPAKRTP